jgi:ligand-binding sensor domain-containing protein
MTIFEDHTGIFWLGTYGGGLNRFDPDRGCFSHYLYHPDNTNSISHNTILCIHKDLNGILWIGTMGGGLNKFNPRTKSFTHYGVRDGLPNNCIYGILEDDEGRLWMSTNYGLSRFDPRTRIFKNFNSNDGLQSNEFNTFSYYKSPNGEMFFGGINGLNSFFPEQIKSNDFTPRIVFTKIIKFGFERSEIKHFFNNDIIKMTYKDSISIEFAALDYSNSEKNQYAYMLEDLHQDWIQLGNKHEITFARINGDDRSNSDFSLAPNSFEKTGHQIEVRNHNGTVFHQQKYLKPGTGSDPVDSRWQSQ